MYQWNEYLLLKLKIIIYHGSNDRITWLTQKAHTKARYPYADNGIGFMSTASW